MFCLQVGDPEHMCVGHRPKIASTDFKSQPLEHFRCAFRFRDDGLKVRCLLQERQLVVLPEQKWMHLELPIGSASWSGRGNSRAKVRLKACRNTVAKERETQEESSKRECTAWMHNLEGQISHLRHVLLPAASVSKLRCAEVMSIPLHLHVLQAHTDSFSVVLFVCRVSASSCHTASLWDPGY